MDMTLILELWNTLGWFGKCLAVLIAIHPVASVVVAVTPTPVDDKWPGLIYHKLLMPLALAIGKARPKDAK